MDLRRAFDGGDFSGGEEQCRACGPRFEPQARRYNVSFSVVLRRSAGTPLRCFYSLAALYQFDFVFRQFPRKTSKILKIICWNQFALSRKYNWLPVIGLV
jgi:hypothetical protein